MALTVVDVLKIKEALQPEFDSICNELTGVKNDFKKIKTAIAQITGDVTNIRKDVNEIRTVLGSQVE